MNASPILDVPADRFEADVLARSHEVPVVVDFWAPWCGPCRTLGPILEQLATQDGGRWLLAKVNSDHAQHLAQRYGVQGIPAVFAFVDGEVAGQFTGVRPPDWIRSWLEDFVPDPAEEQARDGDARAAEGDRPGAVAAWQAALDLDPGQPRARLGLAQDALSRGDADTAAQWVRVLGDGASLPQPLKTRLGQLKLKLEGGGDVESLRAAVEADPEDLDDRWQLAHALAANEHWEGAIEHLLAIVARSRTFKDDGARKALLRFFDVLGDQHEATRKGRQRLGMLLF